MSIKEIMSDSIFLRKEGRYLGAFALLCAAIGGSSRKMYPERYNRYKQTGVTDKDAFTNCLNIAITKSLNGNYTEDINKSVIFSFQYKGKTVNFGTVIYEFFRCNLIHEASLPEGIEILEKFNDSTPVLYIEGLRFVINDKLLCLGTEWLDFLSDCIVHLKVNLKDFNMKNKYCIIKPPHTEEEFNNFAREKLGASCHGIITYIGGYITHCMLAGKTDFSDHTQIEEDFIMFDEKNILGGPMIFVLKNSSVLDHQGKLTQGGMDVIDYMSNKYQVVTE
ncbi:hypothetical protein [Klebsiella grimontii]|uniref:hypothetical protein n=1 Tax=Klebsiella grimontii TaxID=2058152 RepID=UPI0012B98C42|nr:hypothetical protein [Klebsiella grimontii]